METRKKLPLLMLIIILILSMIIWFYPPTGDFRVENPFWNGISNLNEQKNVTPTNSFDNLPSSSSGTTLLIVPYEQFTNTELEQLKNYAATGGTIVILDDYGFGNQVLNSLGLKLKFTGQTLLDPLFEYKNQQLPKITDFTNLPTNASISSIVLNHATTLQDTSSATIIASSSTFSYQDSNNNQELDTNEPKGPLPVVASEKLGQGFVIAVADPSILINNMISIDDNANFIDEIINLQGPVNQIFIDQNHLPNSPLDTAKSDMAFVYNLVASPIGTLTLIAVVLAISLKPIWKKRA